MIWENNHATQEELKQQQLDKVKFDQSIIQ